MALLKTWSSGLACLLLVAWSTATDASPKPGQEDVDLEKRSPDEPRNIYSGLNNLQRRNMDPAATYFITSTEGWKLGFAADAAAALKAKMVLAKAAAEDPWGPGRKRR